VSTFKFKLAGAAALGGKQGKSAAEAVGPISQRV
jgi:hypothetical protein